jgi:hypothetical protein
MHTQVLQVSNNQFRENREELPLVVTEFKAFPHLTFNLNDPSQIHHTLNGQFTTHKLTNNNYS